MNITNISPQIEQTVLGCLMMGAEFDEISHIITAEDFAMDKHRQLFKLIKDHNTNQKPYDLVSLLEHVEIDADYIKHLTYGTGSTANIISYAKVLSQFGLERKVRKLISEILCELNHENALKLITKLQENLEKITAHQLPEDKNWQEVIKIGIESIDALSQQNEQIIYSGLPECDDILRNLSGSRMIVIAARPSVGKTALAQQIALRSAAQNKKVGIISLEMNYDELAIRAFSNCLKLNSTLLSRGDPSEAQKVFTQFDSLSDFQIFMDDSTDSLAGIVARISSWKRKHHIDFVIIDHIGLIELEGHQSRNDMLGKISRTIKKLCKRLSMPIIVLSQLNRNAEKENRQPKLSDLRDSGNIEQDADMVVLLHRVDNEYDQNNQAIELGIEKNRNGPKGWLKKPINFNGRTQSFYSTNN